MSGREFARRVGIASQSLTKYEREGGSLPGADLLRRMCVASGVSADWLLGLSDEKGRGANRPQVDANSLAEVVRILAPFNAPVSSMSAEDLTRRVDSLEAAVKRLAALIVR